MFDKIVRTLLNRRFGGPNFIEVLGLGFDFGWLRFRWCGPCSCLASISSAVVVLSDALSMRVSPKDAAVLDPDVVNTSLHGFVERIRLASGSAKTAGYAGLGTA